MRTNTILAIIMLGIAVAVCGYIGMAYTSRENVVDSGPPDMMMEKTNTFPIPPIAGTIAFVAGIVLLVMGGKRG
jgi:hypothetical protein